MKNFLRSFDCSSVKARDTSKCHYGGKIFEAGDKFHNDDIESSCTIGCYCRGAEDTSSIAKFDCTHIDCPEFFGRSPNPPGKKCVDTYGEKSCCIKETICGKSQDVQGFQNEFLNLLFYVGEDLTKLAKCEFGGKTYYEGERIDTDQSCYSCFCGKDFEDKPVEENKHCHKINCNIELHYLKRWATGCIPIYYKTDDCCPIGWRCPDEITTVVEDKSQTKTDKPVVPVDEDKQCTFGKLRMNIGDFLSPDENSSQCTICSCKVPPHPHCIQTCN